MRVGDERGLWAPFRSLVGAQGVSVVLGLVFWLLAARLVPTVEVGVAAAAISTQTLLGLVASLGVGTHLVTELPRSGSRRRTLLLRGLLTVGAAGALLGGVVALAVQLVGQLVGGALGAALDDPVRATVFVVGSAVAAIVLVLDEAVLGLRRASVQLLRNVTASCLRLPLALLLLGVGARDALVLQLCWVVPLVVSVAVAWRRLRLDADAAQVAVRDDLAAHARPALRHHSLNLAVAAATQLVPVAAGLTLVATDNAALAVAWLLATVAFLAPYLLTVSLFAHAVHEGPDVFRAAMRHTLPVALGISLVTIAGAWLLGDEVLGLFGGAYADQSYELLALLVPAGLWMVVKDHLVAWWRAERRFALAAGLAAASVVLEIGGAIVGAIVGGAPGLVLGWLTVMALESVVAAPLLWRVLHPRARAVPHTVGPAADLDPELEMTPAHEPAELDDPRRRTLAAAATLAVTLVLGLLAWLAVPALDDLQDGSPSAGFSAGPGGSGSEPYLAAGEVIACDDTSRPVLDLSVKTDTGDAAAPHLTYSQVERLVALADRAGADVVSTTVSWRVLRPTRADGYDFRGLDRLLGAAGRHGLGVRLQLVHTPDWAVDGPPTTEWRPPTTPDELRRWSRFAADVVRHLDGRAQYLEAWTEPNRAATWRTGPDPAAFANLLRVTSGAVRRTDPSVQVISGGLASNDVGYDEALASVLGDARPFCQLGIHPWTEAPPTSASLVREGRRGEVDDSFLGFRTVQASLDMPVYLGETGYTSGVDERQRAGYATEILDLAACSAEVEGVSWYHLHPTAWDPIEWSLLDAEGRPGATYDALQAWTRLNRELTTRDGA